MSKNNANKQVEDASETKLLTISEQAMGVIQLPNGIVARVVRQITFPLLKQRDDEVVVFTVKSKMFQGKQMKPKDGEPAQRPATLVNVTNASNNTDMQYIVSAVLKDCFDVDYPDDSYIGKSFAVKKLPKVEGKRHKDMNIVEVSLA